MSLDLGFTPTGANNITHEVINLKDAIDPEPTVVASLATLCTANGFS
jgi:hypothetical protein